jgi:hypothetical protein
MTRTYVGWGLLVAVPLFAAITSANAQGPRPSAASAASANPKDAGGGKAPEGKKEETDAEKQLKIQDRAARQKMMRGALKAKLAPMLKGPIDEALKAELKRNAETNARLLRVKEIALEAKDNGSANQAEKLLDTEKARHDRWLSDHLAKAPDKGGAK